MTYKIAGPVLAACLALTVASDLLAAPKPSPPPRGESVDSIAVRTSKNDAVVALRTSVPVPRYICTLTKSGPREVVIDFPAATTNLKNRYALDNSLVTQAMVERRPAPGLALRIRLTLGEGVLSSVEHAEQGLFLRFQEADFDQAPASVRAASTSPVPAPPPKPPASRSPAAKSPSAAPPASPADPTAPPAASTSDYLVGPGDKLEVAVYGHPDLSRVLEVRADGTIDFPLLGDVSVAGKGLSMIDKEITASLGKNFLIDPQVSVSMHEYGSQFVTVIGEIRTPGRHLLRQNMYLIDLLAEAGGLTPYANRKQVEILRSESVDKRRKLRVNLRDIEAGKEADLRLSPGDVVIVPRRTF